MSFKPFYIHCHKGPGKLANRNPRGFTVKISPSDSEREVNIQLTMCAPKDQYSKKEGRSFAEAAPAEKYNKRKVPAILAFLAGQCDIRDKAKEQDWMYTLKHMI